MKLEGVGDRVALRAIPAASTPVPAPIHSSSRPPKSAAKSRPRPSCCRSPFRRCEGGRRPRSPPSQMPWSRRTPPRRALPLPRCRGSEGRARDRNLEAQIVGRAELVDGGAAGGEILDHLRRHGLRKGGDTARYDAVISRENSDQRPQDHRRRPALPRRQPRGDSSRRPNDPGGLVSAHSRSRTFAAAPASPAGILRSIAEIIERQPGGGCDHGAGTNVRARFLGRR